MTLRRMLLGLIAVWMFSTSYALASVCGVAAYTPIWTMRLESSPSDDRWPATLQLEAHGDGFEILDPDSAVFSLTVAPS